MGNTDQVDNHLVSGRSYLAVFYGWSGLLDCLGQIGRKLGFRHGVGGGVITILA